jgi:hypothetical protein
MTDTVPSVRKPRRSFLEQMKFNIEKSIELLSMSRKRLAKAGFDVEALNDTGLLNAVLTAITDGVQVTAVRSAGISVGDTVAVKEKFVPKYSVIGSDVDLNGLEVISIVPGRGGCIVVRCDATRFKVAANHVKRV